jgi:hypothetical protein
MRTTIYLALLLPLSICGPSRAQSLPGDCPTEPSIYKFVDCKVLAAIARRTKVEGTIHDYSKQSGGPALADNSSSLVDMSGASDVASASMNFFGLTTKSRSSNSSDLTTSTSLYALYAAAARFNPLDFEQFTDHPTLRRLSISLTDSFAEGATAKASDGSYTYGAKFVAVNGRDLTSGVNSTRVDQIANALATSSIPYGGATGEIRDYLFIRFSDLVVDPSVVDSSERHRQFVSAVNDEGKKAFSKLLTALLADETAITIVDQIINRLIPSELPLISTVETNVKAIQTAGQLSIGFSSKISKGTGANTYRFEAIYDRPPVPWFKTTTNVGYDFQNAQTASSRNRNIARFAEQVQIPLNGYKSPPKVPLKLGLSGEGKWGDNGGPQYKAQCAITITPIPGFDLPLSVTYVNRTPGVDRADLKGQLGINVDFAKLLKRSTPTFLGPN